MRDRIERSEQQALKQQMIGVRQRAGSRKEDVRIENGAVDERRWIRQERLHVPAENPEIEVGIAGT
jgi:hypothetical protein